MSIKQIALALIVTCSLGFVVGRAPPNRADEPAAHDPAPRGVGGLSPQPRQHKYDRYNEEIKSLIVRQLLLGDTPESRGEAQRQLEDDVSRASKREKSSVEGDLLWVLANPRNQVRHPDAVRGAMRLLGRQQSRAALRFLIPYMTFPVNTPCLGYGSDGNPCDPLLAPDSYLTIHIATSDGLGRSIVQWCPAVLALIDIGEPAIEPVARELARAEEPVRIRCCLKVLTELEKKHASARRAIDKATEKAWDSSDADRIPRYEKVLKENPDAILLDEEAWGEG
ncbi:MAG TPA: hypothetical protein VF278_16285 [Pirellulales bacterium]